MSAGGQTLKYGPHRRQRVWVADGCKIGGTWLAVIHGGIWSDEKITEQAGIKLAVGLQHLFRGVASIDYRLSPEFVHPTHLEDCRAAITELHSDFQFTSLVLAGHSAGAFLAGQLATEYLLPQGVTLAGIVALEGLFNLNELICEYPSYRDYIAKAFGPDEEKWREANPHWADITSPITVVHSREDELVSLQQPRWCTRNSHAELVVLENGGHDEVLEAGLSDVLAPHVAKFLIPAAKHVAQDYKRYSPACSRH